MEGWIPERTSCLRELGLEGWGRVGVMWYLCVMNTCPYLGLWPWGQMGQGYLWR